MDSTLKEKLGKVKAVVFDGDGVLFSGRVFINPETGETLKERSHIDGQGISFLRAAGIRVAFVSGESAGFLQKLGEKLNSIPSVKSGKWSEVAIFTGPQGKEKVSVIEAWLSEIKVNWEECAGMGDDIPDYQFLKRVGVAVAPAQAEEIIKNIAHYVTARQGGNGAVRDLCDAILESKNIDVLSLALR